MVAHSHFIRHLRKCVSHYAALFVTLLTSPPLMGLVTSYRRPTTLIPLIVTLLVKEPSAVSDTVER